MRSHAATLKLAVFPRATPVADVALIAIAAALIALSAQIAIPLPFTPVPITFQTLTILLVGASMGTTRGGASAILYLLVGLIGAPVYADGEHGLTALIGPSGGYLLSFPLAAALTGWLAERRWDRGFLSATSTMLGGSTVIYTVGLIWLGLTLHTGVEKTLELGFYPFIVGDLCKLLVAALALPAAWRIVKKVRSSE